MKISFICEACKKTLEGWGTPVLPEEARDPKYIELISKFNTPQPLMMAFAGQNTAYWMCAECHDKFATIATSWIKAGLILFGKDELKP